MTRTFTCIVCPRGCSVTAETDENGTIRSITGNSCRRGYDYVADELTCPRRTLTTTVRAEDGRMLPVRTRGTVPKETLFACMDAISALAVRAPIKAGEVVLSDILGTGTDVIASADLEER